jgi:regulator of replication initiation timing
MNTREIEAEVQRIERAIKEREREIAELKIMLRDLWTERTVNKLLYRGHRSRSARAA